MEKTVTSIIVASFLFSIVLMLGLIVGLEKVIYHLQYRTIEKSFQTNADLLGHYIENEESSDGLLAASVFLKKSEEISTVNSFHDKRLALAESGLLISEYYADKFSKSLSDPMKNLEWLVEGSNAYKIAALHQFVPVSRDNKNLISKINRIYVRSDHDFLHWSKTGYEITEMLSKEVPRLRTKINKLKDRI